MAKKEAVAKKDEPEKPEQSEPKSGVGVAGFFQDTREELSKVVWPSRQQLISESLAVIAMVVLSATLIYLVDNLFAWVAGIVFK